MKIKKILKEETLEQAISGADITKAERTLGTDTEVESDVGEIEKTLTDALEQAELAKLTDTKDWVNVLFVGPAGSGKTARIKAWAQNHGVQFVEKRTADLDETDLGGTVAADLELKKAIKLGSTEMDTLDSEPSVLFLDEYNRARDSIRGSLLTLIQDHIIADPSSKDSVKYLQNFLFTIAAINPSEEDLADYLKVMHPDQEVDYDVVSSNSFAVKALDQAEKSRFIRKFVEADPKATAKYLINKYQKQLDNPKIPDKFIPIIKGRQALADKILNSNKFSFDTYEDMRDSKESGNGLILMPRTFELVLNSCNGTKEDFLNKWNESANSNRKAEIEDILANYVDKVDKANSVFNRGTTSDMLGSKQSAFSKLRDLGKLD